MILHVFTKHILSPCRGARSAEKAGREAGPLRSTGPDVSSWPDAASSPTGTQRLSWTSGAPRRTGEGHGLSPTLTAVPPCSPCLSLASFPGPAPCAGPRARRCCLPSCWGPHPTPPLSPSHICLKELESTPAQCWHELLNSGWSHE